ncbi:MAG: RDD family protein [Chloroflexi bacterium]|nr:RDD family protein [Chloroflexota bacterium]
MTKASLGSRFAAIFVDGIILGIVTGALAALLGRADIGSIGGFLLSVAYNGFFWTRYNGQTPGKMLLRIRVVKKDGGSLTWADAIIRVAGYFINTAVFLIGWIWAFIDADRQGWHDKLAGTYVVQA